ncbi:MAG: HD domain-containing protein [Desulfovibrio sp.]|nr:HD domain-containing protein [Desulfovibrio sp.]MBI4959954.1 HD domain-containing protein [Desulfovibrio sp.]
MKLLCALEECRGTYRCGQLTATVHQIAETLGRAVDAKDSRLFEHSALTADFATVLALAHGLSAKQTDLVHIAGHLHDIGKIGIPDNIFLKPAKLDRSEWALIREHPKIGAEILRPIELFSARHGVVDMVLSHHERFDGGGYPHGLSGRDIPLGGRILAVADSLAAMLEHRAYRQPMSLSEALHEIERCTGSWYDPEICRDLLGNIDEFAEVLLRHSGGSAPKERLTSRAQARAFAQALEETS